ncbi:protease inhibitor I42 family protein [Azohydromonas caseinilytica]|uniref:Protease inhibitor I42 family protein n=1 Tax=Azohydromonas caseinilytica TaxID=2728836 RepID=A0A848F0R6_9BURK|nr:protease inhibitor I42 family protein [Azohydromonas caseinilytica]NML13647.1 protease inhibitor I42 family protein [Azohydromonas caseinilytica]
MPIEISAQDPGASHTLALGDELSLHLDENPTTGYRWQFTQSGAGELALVDDRFVTGSAAPAPGAGGQRVLRFVARKPGEVRLEVANRRAWEPADSALERRVYAILIR